MYACIVYVVFLLVASGAADAGEPGVTAPPEAPRSEAYTSAAGSSSGVGAHGSLVWSMSGPVEQPGWRVRSGAAYGYSRTDVEVTQSARAMRHRHERTDGDLALGYQADLGRLWLKLYGGAAFRESFDKLSGQPVRRNSDMGALAIAEAWLRIGGRLWASADVTWTSLDGGVSVFSRAGADFVVRGEHFRLSGGLEGGVHAADLDVLSLKAGLFGRANWGANEVTLSGGLAQSGASEEWQAYGGVSYGRKF